MADRVARTVVLADHHPLWIEAVEPIMVGLGMEVAGKTSSSTEALELIELHRCDVLITGITMPAGEMNGIELTAAATERLPTLKVIVLASETDQRQIDAVFRAGAVAYVIKTAHADDLRSVIQQAFSHSIFLPSLLPSPPPPPRVPPPPPRSGTQSVGGIELTPREVEILQLVAEGMSNAELAGRLWVGEQTIKFHLSNVYRKLHVANRTEASRWAASHGLLAVDPRNSSAV
jgi:DNA-binding NarL/FixJ family response regulator